MTSKSYKSQENIVWQLRDAENGSIDKNTPVCKIPAKQEKQLRKPWLICAKH